MLGVRCLPRHTFLLYADHGILQLTEAFVSLLMTGTTTHAQRLHNQTLHEEVYMI